MVRISDILKKGHGEEGEPESKKPLEEEVGKERAFSVSSEDVNKKSPAQPQDRQVREKGRPDGQVEIARVMMERTKAGRPDAEEIYQELITLIKDVLAKGTKNEPIEGKEILAKIDRLVEQMTLGSEELIALTNRSDPDNYLYAHLVNVCLLSLRVGLSLGYNKSRLRELGLAAFLHDVGMVKVMDIVQHPSKLTAEEYDAVKQHPVYGTEILKQAKDLAKVVIYVAHEQHERLDGSGYPQGLKGDEINEYAQIVGLIDTYESLTHPRPHREKFLPYAAMKDILKDKAQFSPRFLKVLIEEISVYPIGSWVRLNTGEVGKVIKVNKGLPLRPTVEVIFGSEARKLDKARLIDLTMHPTLYIKKPLDDDELESKREFYPSGNF